MGHVLRRRRGPACRRRGGSQRAVSTREADDLVRAVDTFYTQVEASLRLSTTPALTATTDPQSVLTQPWMQAS